MKKVNQFLTRIPALLSSKLSIFIYLFLFLYLVIFAVLTMWIPFLKNVQPSADVQLILGNYTNVLSALGASLAAGSGTLIHHSLSTLHKKHDTMQDELKKTIAELHEKIDRLEQNKE
ncbi:hypothetical protein UAY_01380 [Enterococcus moraviensis ATCC BAA-383]|uniref:Uncharacterized protein n=1 Tax=Enterococcus moraviensis ATCC BAA-383 TaxID=1158609 RepID=R2R2T3_9ENTE|nr:hypothetical protein [Enterococcus moraviensis]EOI01971.1 hypothetical protein UAY_01380 [Enterococcus moraviensis ATCC BAA-383]EOT73494.1 hypothetical protein I586_00487 [Enterococcus moraviensis ATCC BAA-383]OJG69054.1 hypothetical protein RV09_GL000453 [Enterococcus moraviensis]